MHATWSRGPCWTALIPPSTLETSGPPTSAATDASAQTADVDVLIVAAFGTYRVNMLGKPGCQTARSASF